jgi:hypothetical protein
MGLGEGWGEGLVGVERKDFHVHFRIHNIETYFAVLLGTVDRPPPVPSLCERSRSLSILVRH